MTQVQTFDDLVKQSLPDPVDITEEDRSPETDFERLIDDGLSEASMESDQLSVFQVATRLAEIREAASDPDRSTLGEFLVSLGPRAGFQLLRAGAGLEQAFGRSGIRFGPVPAPFAVTQGEALEMLAAQGLARFPRSKDNGITLRRTLGDAAESAPTLIAAAGLSVVAPQSIPLQLVIFGSTLGASAAGQQYLDTLRETGNHKDALLEGASAGVIETFVERFTFGQAVLGKIPKSLMRNAATRVATRMVGGAAGESVEELTSAVSQEIVTALVRDEPERLKAILELDPAFVDSVIRQMLAGATAGGFSAGAVSIIETAKIAKMRKRLAKGFGVRPEDIDALHEAMQAGIEMGLAPEAAEAAAAPPATVPAPSPGPPPVPPVSEAPTTAERDRPVMPPIPNPKTPEQVAEERFDALPGIYTFGGHRSLFQAWARGEVGIDEVVDQVMAPFRRGEQGDPEILNLERDVIRRGGHMEAFHAAEEDLRESLTAIDEATPAPKVPRGTSEEAAAPPPPPAAPKPVDELERVKEIGLDAAIDEALAESEAREAAQAPPAKPPAAAAAEGEGEGDQPQTPAEKLRVALDKLRKSAKREVTAGPKAKEAARTAGALPATQRRIGKEAKEEAVGESRAAGAEAQGVLREALQQLRRKFILQVALMGKKAKATEAMRTDLAKIIRDAFPGRTVPKSLLRAVNKAKSTRSFARALTLAKEALDDLHLKASQRALRKAMKEAAKRPGFATELKQRVKEILDSIQHFAPSEATRNAISTQLAGLGSIDLSDPDVQKHLSRWFRGVERLFKTPVSKLSREDAIRLADVLTEAIKEQKTIEKVRRDRFNAVVKTLAPKIAEEIKANTKELNRQPSGAEVVPLAERRALLEIMTSAASYTTPTVLAEMLGGSRGSQTWQVFYNILHEARSAALALHDQATDAEEQMLKDAGIGLGSEELRKSSRVLSGRNIRGGDTKATIVADPVTGNKGGLEIDGKVIPGAQAEWAHILAMLEDESTFDLVFNPPKKKAAKVETGEEVVSDIEPVDAAGVPFIFESHGAHAEPFHITIDDLQKIHAAAGPLAGLVKPMVDYANGPVSEQLRKYFMEYKSIDPIGDRRWFTRVRRVKGAKEPDLNTMAVEELDRAAMNQAGMGQARGNDRVSPFVVRDLFQVYRNMTWTAAMLSQFSPALRASRAIFQSDDVQSTLKKSQFRRAIRQIDMMHHQLARDAIGTPFNRTANEAAWRRLISRVGPGLLRWNIAVNMYQYVSAISAREYIPLGHLLGAVPEVLSDPKAIEERMYKLSPDLKFRELQSAIGLIYEGAQRPGKLLGVDDPTDWGLRGMKKADHRTILVIWRGAERVADTLVLQGRLKPDARDNFVKQLAEETVQNTQPNFDTLHSPFIAMEAQRSALIRMATFFRSQLGMFYAGTLRDVHRVRRAIDRHENVGFEVRRASANFLFNIVLNSIAVQAISDSVGFLLRGFHFDDRDDDLLTFLRRSAINMAGVVPLGNFLANAVSWGAGAGGADPNFSPAFSLVEHGATDIGSFGRNLTKGEYKKAAGNALDAIAILLTFYGIPGVPLLRQTSQFYEGVLEADEETGGRGFRRSH